jgi:hypothetical protein
MSSPSASEFSEKALALPLTARAALLDRVFDSIDSELDTAVLQKKWADESEKRIDAFNRGELKTAAGPAAIARLRKSVGDDL